MSKHKKCVMGYCDKTATKWIRVDIPDHDEQIGGWEWERANKRDGGVYTMKRHKNRKLHVCSVCYDVLEPEDIKATVGGIPHKVTKIERL